MKSTLVDRWFINSISRKYNEEIERSLSSRIQLIQSATLVHRSQLRVLASSLFQYTLLLLELMRAAVTSGSVDQDTILLFDLQTHHLPGRIAYLTHVLGEHQFTGISRDSRILSISDIQAVLRIMPRLAICILAAPFYGSDLAQNYVWIVRACFLTLSYACLGKNQGIYLFSIYRPEILFIAAFLKDRGIFVNLVASSTPLSVYNRVLIGNALKVCTAYQCDEFRHYQKLRQGEELTCELWAPHTIPAMDKRYQTVPISEHYDTIGVYTQGFWLRANMGTLHPDAAQGTVQRERELLETMLAWLEQHSDTRLVLFPHPLERRHFHQTRQHQFGWMLEHGQVTLEIENVEGSYLQFDRVGLGVTTLSSIGFDRLHMGLRTLFYVPPMIHDLELINPEVESRYNPLFIPDRTVLLEVMEKVRRMSHRQFMHSYFGQESFHGSPVD